MASRRAGVFHPPNHDRQDTTMDQEEQQPLLGDEELGDDEGWRPSRTSSDPLTPNPHQSLPIYRTIHRIRRLIIDSIDDPYSVEQLKSPRMNTTTLRPLIDHLYDSENFSIVYCLLVNRCQFLRQQSYRAHHSSVNLTRANVCELLASRVLRRFDEEYQGRRGLLVVANVLVAHFEPFQNAPPEVAQTNEAALHWTKMQHAAGELRTARKRALTTLEVAIVSESKNFLSTAACQRIVDAVYRGRIIYTPTSFIDILPDHYKTRNICLYDPGSAPLLNQYRLIVPRTRNLIEIMQFVVLLVLYALTMHNKATSVGPRHLHFTTYELVFDCYAMGWVLDEFAAALEHGWTVHTQNLWSFLDIAFAVVWVTYFGIQMQGLACDDGSTSNLALDILSLGAPILLPRLAFCLMPENMLFISLRAMVADFAFLTVLTAWCFAGFLLALQWLDQGRQGYNPHEPITIAKWMLWIWFGLDGTGVSRSAEMHWLLGPALMITFAFLGNTLFLTILVAMLSNTFTNLAQNATAEIQYRRAVLTFEGVKSDAIFAYRPPFNILALVFLLPIKMVVSDRWFHKINVTAIRTLNAPILLTISLYERKFLWQRPLSYAPRRKQTWLTMWQRFGAHGDLQAVFDTDPPQSMLDEMEDASEVLGHVDDHVQTAIETRGEDSGK